MSLHRPIKALGAVLPAPAGSGGMMGGKGGSTGSGGVEAPDTLRSHQSARIIDLIGEGPNRGIVGWTKGIFFDGVPVQNPDGSYNFSNAILQQVLGYPDQPVISGFSNQQSEVAVGGLIKQALPLTRAIINLNTDRVRVTVSVPSLQSIDSASGNISGTAVDYEILIQNNGGGYNSRGGFSINGKTTSRYQRATILSLPRPGPWDIRVRRITADSAQATLQNDLYWDSLTEIIDAKVNYSNSHCLGTIIDAEQFASIPARTFLVDGRIILVPSNYDPDARTYSGVWDGTFKSAWSNSPPWCLYDMVVNNRYGLGDFLGAGDIDKWALYEIAQWCDGLVPNGRGGYEPRFVCNTAIRTRADAFDVLASLASVFRGFTYWTGGQLVAVADQPRAISGIFTAANVIDGRFDYAGADMRAHHNLAQVGWFDGDNLGQARLAIVEDQESISRFGTLEAPVESVGATTESQAIRTGKWLVYTENYEDEVVRFSVGLSGAWVKPGDIVAIADKLIGGERRGGRVVSATNVAVTLDAPVTIAAGQTGQLSVVIGEGRVETLRVTGVDAAGLVVTVYGSFSAVPEAGAVWVLATGDLETTTWRIMGASEDNGIFRVTAQAHDPAKWGHIEANLALSTPDITNIAPMPPAVQNLAIVEHMVRSGASSVAVVALLSWTSRAPAFDVDYRPDNGNWQRSRVQTTAIELPVAEGWWNFQVTPVSVLGRKGATRTLRYEIIGRMAPPAAPKQFRVSVHEGLALFAWLPATEIDVLIGGHFELRFTPRQTGVTWQNAQTVVNSVPGNATSTESFYQAGTYLLRTFDASGIQSETASAIITNEPDIAYTPYYRFCESPEYIGIHHDTVRKMPEEWLIIDQTGGMWDDQARTSDLWKAPAVDVLPLDGLDPDPGYGTSGMYEFYNQLDLGGEFSTRLSVDLLAFPYWPGDLTIDQRITDSDTWKDWDSSNADLDGAVIIWVRQTKDDPLDVEAVWTDWRVFSAGEYTGWGFQFRAVLQASPGQNVAVETLCVLADIRNKIESGEDVFINASTLTVPLKLRFYSVPAVTITIQEALPGDQVVLSNKTTTSFDMIILNGEGVPVARYVDYHVIGY